MADERDDFERSEEATPKRKQDARKKGQVARSRTLIPTAALLGAVLMLPTVGANLTEAVQRLFQGFFSLAGEPRELSSQEVFALALEASRITLPAVGLLFGVVFVSGVGSGLLQTQFLWSTELLQPDFSRLNPLTGLRRLFGFEALGEIGKSLLGIAGLGALGVFFLYGNLPMLFSLPALEPGEVLFFGNREGLWFLQAGVGVMALLAFLDHMFQRWRLQVQLRMSRQEVKEELREQEGDPHIKGRLRSLRQKMARQRMMAEVPKADVVITNPTHLAIALRYRPEEMAAPRMVAKGAGFVAQRIREIARSNSIPILENKPLARMLYSQVEVGGEIPEALYRAVAEVLAYILRLRRERGLGARG
ncbi:MAG: flagellar biosynthesis protein FlhB [Deltaproteobacteria bacterium]|nr:flagellar biosynthesis protein FlhB [Deltaproteobacteria bacterium]